MLILTNKCSFISPNPMTSHSKTLLSQDPKLYSKDPSRCKKRL
jgi:hypothetical protein